MYLGILAIGATVTTINPSYTESEIRHQASHSGAKLTVTTGSFLDTVVAATDMPLVVIPEAGDSVVTLSTYGSDAARMQQWGEFLTNDKQFMVVPSTPEGLAIIPYSSGTTGLPKAR